jgi:hypothetical protein
MNARSVEASIKSISTFFSALVGISLSHLLNNGIDHGQHAWFPFIVATLLFLRFITGSANHLWHTYNDLNGQTIPDSTGMPSLESDGKTIKLKLIAKNDLILDLSILTVFGILATAMCFSQTSEQFLCRGIILFIATVFWNLFDRIIYSKDQKDSQCAYEWTFWLWLNIIHFLFFVVAFLLESCEIGNVDFGLFRTHWSWLILVVSGLIILGVDFNCQFEVFTSHNAD